MPTPPTLATGERVTKVVAMLGRAFVDDPLLRHFLGPAAGDVGVTTTFIRLTIDHVFQTNGETWETGDAVAAAVWAAPGHWEPTEDAVATLAGPMIELMGLEHIGVTLRAMEATAAVHPTTDSWYLAYLGTEPGHRGRGHGSAALRPVLERCDATGVGAYLESSRVENCPLYERHGFRTVATIELPDGGPTLHGMWRDPVT